MMKRPVALLLMLSLWLTGCSTWATGHRPPVVGADSLHRHSRVRVTLDDSTRIVLRDAVVRPESVYGIEEGAGYSTSRALDRERVLALQPGKIDVGMTILVVGGVAAGTLFLMSALVCGLGDCLGDLGWGS